MSDVWDHVAIVDSEDLSAKVYLGSTLKFSIRLEPNVTYIGRMPENHIILDDPQVSRSHATITCKDGKYILEDQDSENGIIKEGQKILNLEIKEGDEFHIGAHLIRIVKSETAVQAVREAHLDEPEQEWQMNQTINVMDPAAQKLMIEKLKKKKEEEEKKKQNLEKKQYPSLKLEFNIGDQTYKETIEFTRGKMRQAEDQNANYITIQIGYKKYLLHKKITLK